jgi:hypothetical protein
MAEEQPTPHVCQVCEVPLRDHGPACEVEKPRDTAPPKPAGCYTNIISRSNVQALM